MIVSGTSIHAVLIAHVVSAHVVPGLRGVLRIVVVVLRKGGRQACRNGKRQ